MVIGGMMGTGGVVIIVLFGLVGGVWIIVVLSAVRHCRNREKLIVKMEKNHLGNFFLQRISKKIKWKNC